MEAKNNLLEAIGWSEILKSSNNKNKTKNLGA